MNCRCADHGVTPAARRLRIEGKAVSTGACGGHAHGEIQAHGGREAVLGGVQGSGSDTVVGGDADDLHVLDAAILEPFGEADPVGAALEAGVGGCVLTLVEDRLEVGGVQILVQLRASGAHDAVHRPGVDVVGLSREMSAGIDVMIPGGDGVVVAAGGEPTS